MGAATPLTSTTTTTSSTTSSPTSAAPSIGIPADPVDSADPADPADPAYFGWTDEGWCRATSTTSKKGEVFVKIYPPGAAEGVPLLNTRLDPFLVRLVCHPAFTAAIDGLRVAHANGRSAACSAQSGSQSGAEEAGDTRVDSLPILASVFLPEVCAALHQQAAWAGRSRPCFMRVP
jgi:hypothetical protein